ncbi:helix-turn-helix domain-containing protein [Sphingomonas lenta]|uniref:HTH araC/xylS-type domain-containing protein n=1 Tax=Sphingomonas lenta TaxID=1141887 RepID=A0A2A2SJF4_9SPHN|nr:AraC family transcriptional regulator [Sphingomonas lenta]PAX09359.1 hypothetical protein CKY28_00965 [Sphingomonas lenta]
MIESGTHTPGVDARDFALPPQTALRYELPAPALRDYVADYHVLDSEGPDVEGAVNFLLPSWPAIRLILTDRPISLQVGPRFYDPLPRYALYGTTSQAMRMTSNGGVTIGVALKPSGWARLFDRRADLYRDRVAPLADVMASAHVNELVARLGASDRGPAVKGILDEFLERRLGPPHPDEPLIGRLTALINDDETFDLATACERVGLAPATMRRVSLRHFGFPLKTLLIRTRFLRSFARIMMEGADYSSVAPGYYDASHFLRDANRFLGMTPKRFLQRTQNPYAQAVLRARALVTAADRASRNR